MARGGIHAGRSSRVRSRSRLDSASIPREALEGTGISSLEIGTAFPEQPLGDGAAFQGLTSGTVLNLMERRNVDPPLPPVDLALAKLGVKFRPGFSYVLALAGKTLSVRGSDGSTATVESTSGDATHTFVGAMVYTKLTTSVRLYPKLQLSLAAPAVGSSGVLQGEVYSVRLTYGDKTSTYDLLDSTQVPIAKDVTVPSPKATDKSSPRPGDLYFGSFVGGDTMMSVWSVPVFLTVAPADLPGAGFYGTMTLDAEVSGVPGYKLQVTDSSVFVFSNINVDTRSIGSVSDSNVFLASAVINSSPDDTSSKAFMPCKLLMGIVRQARVGNASKFVFVPADDSVVIGTTRYMLSVIELGALDFDPSTRPYPPAAWPRSRYWQFANKHDPYLDVAYTGETQDDRIAQAQQDTTRIGADVHKRREPIHLYLDTNRDLMRLWPIYGFPFDQLTQTVDTSRFRAITDAVLGLIASVPPAAAKPNFGSLDAERIAVPSDLQQPNPYEDSIAPPPSTTNTFAAQQVLSASVGGKAVTNLAPDFVATATVASSTQVSSAKVLTAQRDVAAMALTKSLQPGIAVLQDQPAPGVVNQAPVPVRLQKQVIYGFSAYNPSTGEAYLVELVPADQNVFDRLPNPTENLTYDPFYVRVVFLKTLTCYNMSIIVPAMVHDQYGHFARQRTRYLNLLSKTNELKLGYLYSLSDQNQNFDTLTFEHYPYPIEGTLFSETAIFTNLPYSLARDAPPSLLNRTPTAYFACRRKNWSADCHLMQATHDLGSAAYLAFGAGDLVPLRLDASFQVDKRAAGAPLQAHLHILGSPIRFGEDDLGRQQAVRGRGDDDRHGRAAVHELLDHLHGGYGRPPAHEQPAAQVPEGDLRRWPGEHHAPLDRPDQRQFAHLVDQHRRFDDAGYLRPAGTRRVPAHSVQQSRVHDPRRVEQLRARPGRRARHGFRLTHRHLRAGEPTATWRSRRARGTSGAGCSSSARSYTPTTMVDTLDNLDFTSITGETFFVPTIFIPIPELDASTGFVADISELPRPAVLDLHLSGDRRASRRHRERRDVGPRRQHRRRRQARAIAAEAALRLRPAGRAVHAQRSHAQVRAAAQAASARARRTARSRKASAGVRPTCSRNGCRRPTSARSRSCRAATAWTARTSSTRRTTGRCITSVSDEYMGMSVSSFLVGLRHRLQHRGVGASERPDGYELRLAGIVDDEHGGRRPVRLRQRRPRHVRVRFDDSDTTKGVVFLNGYLSAAGYTFSSPDHFDVNDVLPSQVPLLEQIADTMGFDVAFFNTDVSLPRQFWSLTYDAFTAPGLPDFIPNVPPSIVDPTFTNRTRSLILSLQNPVHPAAARDDGHLQLRRLGEPAPENGVTGSVFLSKKADRDVASIGTNPVGPNTLPLFGLPTKYDFFIFSRDHYWTLKGASFELIDQGYAMCLVDDGTGTGTKVAKYFIDSDGNYYELYTYVLYSPNGGVIETSSFTLRVTLGAPGKPGRDADHSGDAEQREPAGSRRADQQGLESHLRGVWTVEPGPTAGVPADSSGRRGGAGGADRRTAGLQWVFAQCRRGEPPARADLPDLFGQPGVSDRRLDDDHPDQSQDRQAHSVLRLDLARPRPHVAGDACNRADPSSRHPAHRRCRPDRRRACSAATGSAR